MDMALPMQTAGSTKGWTYARHSACGGSGLPPPPPKETRSVPKGAGKLRTLAEAGRLSLGKGPRRRGGPTPQIDLSGADAVLRLDTSALCQSVLPRLRVGTLFRGSVARFGTAIPHRLPGHA